ncbi:5226_t:CDS:2 [Funneliformis geosporum]|uniref:5226_t:CDS:1 n=1 Tax=Funneliformis geosporum TaxID=1117311 RepID=A0A9W4SY59_9GLOM|nr:5226_t:CDS:2 [Funneliformis geosporum]
MVDDDRKKRAEVAFRERLDDLCSEVDKDYQGILKFDGSLEEILEKIKNYDDNHEIKQQMVFSDSYRGLTLIKFGLLKIKDSTCNKCRNQLTKNSLGCYKEIPNQTYFQNKSKKDNKKFCSKQCYTDYYGEYCYECMNKFLMENLYAPIKGNSLELTDFNNKTPPFAICDFCFEKDLEQAKMNSNENRTEPQPTINQIKSLFAQLLTQIQATHSPNSPLYQKALKEQKEALTILENASESKQEKYLSLIRQIEPLLTKPNLSLEEQTKLNQTGQKMDEMMEKLRVKKVKVEQRKNNHKNQVKELDIEKKNLSGILDLSDFTSLKGLYCSYNKLTSLNVSNCSYLTELYCDDNLLTNLTLPNNLTNLKRLKLSNNNFPSQDLSFLAGAINLEELELGNNNKEKINQGIYNKFTDSLNYLSEMKQLKELVISNTDLNEVDITKLPNSLRKIDYFARERPSFGESTNTRLFMSGVLGCYGLSQDTVTKNYVMVMKYMENGNLRQCLQNKTSGLLSFRDKLNKLLNITIGLGNIHQQNLVHRDLHSGNLLSSSFSDIYITDLGLSQPINYQKKESEIFGVLPYLDSEVLQKKPYAKSMAYELFTNSYPYPESNDLDLALRVCRGKRPNMSKLKIPQELKDIDPIKRPTAGELQKIIMDWITEIELKENTLFSKQYREIEAEYNYFSQTAPYRMHPTAVLNSKLIDTKKITQKLQTEQYSQAIDFTEFNLEDEFEENQQPEEKTFAD